MPTTPTQDPVREALRARPMVIGNDRKARPQIWFKWPEVQAYARAAVAALPVQSAEPVAWKYDPAVDLNARQRILADLYDAGHDEARWPEDRHDKWTKVADAYNRLAPSPASVSDSWREAIDEALVINGLDCTSVAEPADRALRRLLAHEIAVATDPAINSPSPASAGDGWQPISTAPKDGTEFQAWVVNEYHEWWEPRSRFVEGSEGFQVFGRVDYDIEDWDYVNAIPTHWRPTPTTPHSTKGGEHA